MNKKIKIILGLIILVLIVWGIYSTSKKSEPVSGEPIKIGMILPLTGDAGDYGQTAQKAANLAVEKIMKESNLEIELIFEDDQMVPQKAVSALQKLISINDIDYVISFSSGEMLAICPLVQENEIVLLGNGSSPEVGQCGDFVFSNTPSDSYQGKVLADKVLEEGYEKVALLYMNNDYGVGLKNEFGKNFGGDILVTEAYNLGDSDFRTQLTKVKSENPDAIVIVSLLPEVSRLLKQRMELGISVPVFGSEGLKNDNLFDDVRGEALEDIFAVFYSQYEGIEYQEFKNNYLQSYGQDYGAFADYVYDNVFVLVNAINECSDIRDTNCVRENIFQTDLVGATGNITYGDDGIVKEKSFSLYQVEDDKFVEVK